MKENDDFNINKNFSKNQFFLNYCKLCLNSILKYVDEHEIVKEVIDFKSDDDKKAFENICNAKNIDYEQWLIENGYKNILYAVYFKHLFFSLLVDFSNYYNASIEMALKGNINVAWALLRKPLQETLAYIEWLCVDRNELLQLMLEENNVKKYEIVNHKLKPRRKEHINIIQSQKGIEFMDMFEFRYSYDKDFTINGILQATNHLITTRATLRTSPSGLNFIFPSDEVINRNIGFYYTTIPFLMTYTMEIVMDLFEEIAKIGDYSIKLNHLNLLLKGLYAMGHTFDDVKKILDLKGFDIICPICGSKHNGDEMWVNFTCNCFICKNCNREINTNRYLFEFEQNETKDN